MSAYNKVYLAFIVAIVGVYCSPYRRFTGYVLAAYWIWFGYQHKIWKLEK